ncbi:MAG: LPS assembly protein LptD [Desulfopila sp.]|nr:LPS assembly protein LptD [Desulfopila sp.]
MTRILPQFKEPQRILAIPALLFLFLFSSTCLAESTATSEWNISADKITRFEKPQRIVAEGSIILEKREKVLPKPAPSGQTGVSSWAELLGEEVQEPKMTPDDLTEEQAPQYQTKTIIKADWISYDIDQQSINAKGNVSIESGEDRLTADEAQIDLSKELGSFAGAVITREDHELHLEGRKVEKTGVNSYRIEDGWVITCKVEKGEVPPWSFSSSEATIEPGGYAFLKNAKFNIKDVPVFYLPYMVVPVKNTRQTGLLFPEFSNSSRDGFGLNLPFFLNISDSTDLTFYPAYYSDRGFMPGAEFNYVASENNKGTLTGSYLDDDLSGSDQTTSYYRDTNFTHTNSDRYWLRGKVDHDFGDNWISRLDLDVVSDRDYLEEFSSGMTGFNASQKSFLETFGRGFQNQSEDQRNNSLKLLKSWNGSSLNIDVLAINDIRADKSGPTPLWTLPSVDYSGALTLQETPITFNWDADYINYWREEGVGGHRIDLFPRISAPVPLGNYLESRAEIGVRGTMYSVETYGDATWTEDDTPTRFLPVFRTDLATMLVRDYSLDGGKRASLSHSIRPFAEYEYIPDDNQNDLPSFDAVDRIDETNAITYGVDSFFDFYDTNRSYTGQYAYVRIEQSYDLRSEASDQPFSPVAMKLGWRPLPGLSLAYKAELPVESDQNATHGLEGYFTNSRGDWFGLDYRYNELLDTEQINASFKVQLLPQVRADFYIEHSLSEEETNEATVALTYVAQCWSVQLNTQYTPTDERIMVVFNLANIGSSLGLSF